MGTSTKSNTKPSTYLEWETQIKSDPKGYFEYHFKFLNAGYLGVVRAAERDIKKLGLIAIPFIDKKLKEKSLKPAIRKILNEMKEDLIKENENVQQEFSVGKKN
ncbi:hypothetical protein KO465_10565 [Candidatus Micrarchaeota archaeon]|jgi:hypothetical protein|nr:hypothetical protein [Candidatus Micrarchaeota archaeon]